jgi:uncharacterized protein with LGFP repeats
VYEAPGIGAHSVVQGPIDDAWGVRNREQGPLGYPTADAACQVNGDCVQTFQNGSVLTVGESAVYAVADPIAAAWTASGAASGPMGHPRAGLRCDLAGGGCLQNFQGGTIYDVPGVGARSVVPGPIYDVWRAQKWETGPLGYPLGDRRCGLVGGGCLQNFQGGSIYTAPGAGTHAVRSDLYGAWRAQGWEGGVLGYPVGDRRCGLVRGGCLQNFQGGTIYTAPAAGTYSVLPGPIYNAWRAQKWEQGSLGYPVGNAVTTTTEITQRFEGGTLVQNRSTGKVTRR